MKPTFLPMVRVREMDELFGKKVHQLRRRIRLSNFDHEDNAIALFAMARDLGVSFDELCSYVWLQTYIAELGESFDDLPYSVQEVAELFGIDLEEFEDYVREWVSIPGNLFLDQEPMDDEDGSLDVLEYEVVARGFTPREWERHLEDLQADAEIQGD